MTLRVGIVGPERSVRLIQSVGDQFTDKITLIPSIYEQPDKIKEILAVGSSMVDVWLFSGIIPYLQSHGLIKKPSYYLHLDNSSLMAVMFQMVCNDAASIRAFSLDTISEEVLKETITELNLSTNCIQLFPDASYSLVEDIVQFHRKFYHDGHVNVCVTGIHAVYAKLSSEGLKVYRIQPTLSSIRQTLQIISQYAEKIDSSRSHIAVQIFQVNHSVHSSYPQGYSMQKMALKIHETVLQYTEHILGRLTSTTDNRYTVYSTKGAIEEHGAHLLEFVDRLYSLTHLPVHVGIGHGITSAAAEYNAYKALEYASRKDPEKAIALVDEGGSIQTSLFLSQNRISESSMLTTEDTKQLKLAGISVQTYYKVLALENSQTEKCVSSAILSKWLGTSTRNANRILKGLHQCSLAYIVGKEAKASQGRPRILYRLTPSTQLGPDQ